MRWSMCQCLPNRCSSRSPIPQYWHRYLSLDLMYRFMPAVIRLSITAPPPDKSLTDPLSFCCCANGPSAQTRLVSEGAFQATTPNSVQPQAQEEPRATKHSLDH